MDDRPETTTQTLQYEAPNPVALLKSANARLLMAERFKVTNDAQLQLAAEDRRAVKVRLRELEDQRKTITDPLDKAKKAVMDLFRAPTQLLEKAVSLYDDGIRSYTEQQARAAAEARRIAEKAAQEERDRMAVEAEALRASGNEAVAAIVTQTASMIVAAPPPAPVKPVAVQMREAWSFEITDEAQIPREYLSVDEQKIRAVVRGLKGSTNIPGVRVFRHDIVANSKSA